MYTMATTTVCDRFKSAPLGRANHNDSQRVPRRAHEIV
jgi:hypothetical protein